MFVFDRSALAVLVPLALLAGIVFYSNRTQPVAQMQQAQQTERGERASDQALAANLPSR
jgi:hypothetical protein